MTGVVRRDRISPAAPYIPTVLTLRCHRCNTLYQTESIGRSCCPPCTGAAMERWPGVVELRFEVGGE